MILESTSSSVDLESPLQSVSKYFYNFTDHSCVLPISAANSDYSLEETK
jgi:hypothetical protein